MILLVTSCSQAGECAAAITKETGERVQVAPTLQAADTALRGGEFAVVVMDQVLFDTAPEHAGTMLRKGGDAVPLLLNFGISGVTRVMVEVRSAVQRKQRELLRARHAAAAQLRSELMEAVTGILLSSDLALRDGDVVAMQERVRAVRKLAGDMRERLEAAH